MAGRAPDIRMRVALLFYAVIWAVGLPVILFYLWRRGRADGLYWTHLAERFGRYRTPIKGAVWVHAVSLGEMRSAVPLVRGLLDQGERVVCTHFTPAGRRETARVFGPEIAAGQVQAVWVPFEFAWVYRRFFMAFQPKLGLVMEIEIWPRMIFAARKAGVPLLMCNAQYPSRSMARDAKWSGLGLRHAMMRGFAGALVKSDLQERRFASVGVENIHVTGELRFDQPVPDHLVAQGVKARRGLGRGREVITLASAIEGEDALYINAIQRVSEASDVPPLVVYVPRKPERFDEVFEMLQTAGLRVARRQDVLDADLNLMDPAACDVLLGDSMGEMYFYIAMADRVITGGGFYPKGAHNIIEPLALRKPVIVGPVVHTIEYPYIEAEAAGVCLGVADEDALVAGLLDRDGRPSEAQITTFFAAHAGGTERTLAAIARAVR